MNKTIIFLSIILLFVLLAGGVYFFVLRDTGTPTSPGSSFDPGANPVDIPGEEVGDDFVIDTSSPELTTLTQIHESPVAGSIVRMDEVEVGVGTTTSLVRSPAVQFVDKQTGHVFTYIPEEDVAERTSNTTFPGIQEVYWFEDNSRMVLRYINNDGEIETYLGEVSDGSLSGSYLEVDIPAVQTTNDKLLTVNTTSRGSEGFVSDPDGRNAAPSFESDFTRIRIPTFSDSFIAVLTKPASALGGVLYFYENGAPERILGGKNGLIALPNKEGTQVVFSESSENSFTTQVLNRTTGEIRSLPLDTLPDKCAWAKENILYCMVPEAVPGAQYPEHWYQGRISFTDSLWRVDVDSGTARAISFFDEEGPFDGVELSIDADEEYLVFTNKKDGSLWGFDL